MSALSGIDIALWDMKGTIARLPPPPRADRFDGRTSEGPPGSGLLRSDSVGSCRAGFCSFDVVARATEGGTRRRPAPRAAVVLQMTLLTRPFPLPPVARRLGVPVYQLLGGRVRNKLAVYAWIGGDRPKDVANAA